MTTPRFPAVGDDGVIQDRHLPDRLSSEGVAGAIDEWGTTVGNSTYPAMSLTATRVPAELTHAAIQDALNAAKDTGEIVVAGGVLDTDQTLVIECNCDLSQLTVNYSGDGVAIRVGSPDVVTWRLSARLPRVRHSGKSGTGWDSVAGTVGVELVNLNSCSEVLIPRVGRFEIGLLETGTAGRGHAYNNITLGHLENNKRNHVMRSEGSGWCNENLHLGGRFSHESAEGVSAPGVKHIDIEAADGNSANNNIWVKPSLEGTGNEWAFDCRGVYNRIIGGRWERSGGARIRWGSSSSNNVIDGGYHADRVQVTAEPGSLRNEIHSPSRHDFLGTSSSRGIGVFKNTSSAAAPALEVLSPGDTWAWRVSANTIEGRRSGESEPRLVLDGLSGRVLVGNGVVAPTAGVSSFGSAALSVSGNVNFQNEIRLKSPDGKLWKVSVGNDGVLSATPL